MAHLVVFLIILACIAYQYLKSSLLKAFATIITTICASVVAFAYFEPLTRVFVGIDFIANRFKAGNALGNFALWTPSISFVLLFVLAFAILQTLAGRLTRQPIDLGTLPERIGRIVCGIFLGLILSGLLLTVLTLAPLKNNWPYQRFQQTNPNVEKPHKVLLNADGFVTGLFSLISRGSLSGERSFATLHPAFLDQTFLNRHSIADNVPTLSPVNEISVPTKIAAWPAPPGLKDSTGKAVVPKTGHDLTIIRVGINSVGRITGQTTSKFSMSQLRLICKPDSDPERILTGNGTNIYPIGFLKTENQLQRKRLTDKISLKRDDFDSKIQTPAFRGNVKWIDFAFYVPDDLVPVLAELKQNSIARVPPPVTADQAPAAISFIQISRCAKDIAQLPPIPSAKVYGVQLAAGSRFLETLKLNIDNQEEIQKQFAVTKFQPPRFDEGKITYIRAELTLKVSDEDLEEEEEEEEEERRPRRRTFTPEDLEEGEISIPKMFKPLDGYQLLSLKCNNPSSGTEIKGPQLPVLVEPSGSTHHAVGVIASAKVGDQNIYELDYCSLTADAIPTGLVLAEDGSVAKPFPDTVWLTKQPQSISQFYVLYLVKTGRNTVFTSVRPGDSQLAPAFEEYEGFLVK